MTFVCSARKSKYITFLKKLFLKLNSSVNIVGSLKSSNFSYLILPFTKLPTPALKYSEKNFVMNPESSSADSCSSSKCFMHFPAVMDAASSGSEN